MQSTYRMKGNDLNEEFLNALKLLYKDKDIEIVIRTASKEGEDEFISFESVEKFFDQFKDWMK